jgi:O-6-methylguanine DNA methyltransferase
MEKNFSEKVYDIVRTIPKGKTLTYGQVAALAGKPGAARAVGNILSKNYDPEIPCHRVIRADGKLGGYNRGLKRKAEILTDENNNFKFKNSR